MKDLIEKLEGLGGADREIDAEIAFIAGWRLQSRNLPNVNGASETVTAWFGPDDDMEEDWRTYAEAFKVNLLYDTKSQPRFTDSLDAALTLVPDGWGPLDLDWNASVGKVGASVIGLGDAHGHFPTRDGYARTMPLAICIAALRARQKER